jgi:YggT family protein
MILRLICFVLDVYFVILIVRIIFSFIPQLPEPVLPIARGVRAVTDPLLNPLRNLLPPVRTGAIAFDLSPILLFVGIAILQGLLGCR